MPEQKKKVQSVEKAFVLLNQLWAAGRPLSLTELTHMTGWAKSTIHAMLVSLREVRAVEQSEADGRYWLGYRLMALGGKVSSSWQGVQLARPRLLHIVNTIQESVYLSRLCGDELLLVACAEPNEGFQVCAEAGSSVPLHCTTQGKAILAFMPELEQRRVLEKLALRPYTPQAIQSMDSLKTQLEEVRQRGYAVERGEYNTGLQSVGAPIFDRTGRARYAISIVSAMRGASWREFDQAVKLVTEAAKSISFDLSAMETDNINF